MDNSSVSSSDSEPVFNVVHFISFFTNKDIITAAISAVISYGLRDVTESLINNLIMPIIDKDTDEDGKRDFKKIEETVITINKIKFSVGKLTIDILKFIILMYILFIIENVIKSIHKK